MARKPPPRRPTKAAKKAGRRLAKKGYLAEPVPGRPVKRMRPGTRG
jgi:hypothetical protein